VYTQNKVDKVATWQMEKYFALLSQKKVQKLATFAFQRWIWVATAGNWTPKNTKKQIKGGNLATKTPKNTKKQKPLNTICTQLTNIINTKKYEQ
jgi:hypothetical protein